MRKTFDRNSGFGLLGWVFLVAVLYGFLSLAIGVATKDDSRCRAGYSQQWSFIPPRWECH